MVPLEASGKLLGDVARTFYTVSSADATPEIQQIEETLAPLMSAHHDSIELDSALYWRIKTLHERSTTSTSSRSSAIWCNVASGRCRTPARDWTTRPKQTLTALNQRLSTLTTTFEKNLLRDTNDLAVVFDDAAELDGLAEGELSAAAQAAADRGLDGKWVVTLTLFTGHPYLASLTNRDEPQAHPRRLARARLPRRRERQPRRAARDRPPARRARGAAGLRLARGLHHLGRDRRLSRGRARPAAPARGPGRPQRRSRAGGTPGDHRRGARAVPARGARLGVLHREGAGRRVRPRPGRAAPLVRGRAGAAATACSTRPPSCTASPSRSAPTSARTTPTPACSRCATPTDLRWACSSSTCTRATPSAAARG